MKYHKPDLFKLYAQAQQEYAALAALVTAEGRPELAEKYAPGDTATLAQIEAAIDDMANEARGPINYYVLPTD